MSETIWARGRPLDDAWWDFAPASKRQAYNREVAVKKAEANRLVQQPSSGALGVTFSHILKAMSEPEIAMELKSDLVTKIYKGKLTAYGVPVKPRPSAKPVEIPISMIHLKFSNGKKAISTVGDIPFEMSACAEQKMSSVRPRVRSPLPPQQARLGDTSLNRKDGSSWSLQNFAK